MSRRYPFHLLFVLLGFLPAAFITLQTGVVQAGSVVNSMHDLSAFMKPEASGYSVMHDFNVYRDYDEVCVYCHTPHASSQLAPLWNRQTPAGPYTLYHSPTSDQTSQGPGNASLACLSCHDGSISVDVILNMPGSGLEREWENPSYPGQAPSRSRMKSMAQGAVFTHTPGYFMDCGFCHDHIVPPGQNYVASFMGTDLSKDHPVGIGYPTTPDFKSLPGGGRFPNGIALFGDKIECPTCHNPHEPDNGPFLRTRNDSSAICYTCHNK